MISSRASVALASNGKLPMTEPRKHPSGPGWNWHLPTVADSGGQITVYFKSEFGLYCVGALMILNCDAYRGWKPGALHNTNFNSERLSGVPNQLTLTVAVYLRTGSAGVNKSAVSV